MKDVEIFATEHLKIRVIDACFLFGLHPGHWRHRIRTKGIEPLQDVTTAILLRILSEHPFLTRMAFISDHADLDLTISLLANAHGEKMSDYNLAIFLGKEGSTVGRYRSGTTPTVSVQRMLDLVQLICDPKLNAACTAIWGQSISPQTFLRSWKKAAEDEARARGFGDVTTVGRMRGWTARALERLVANEEKHQPNGTAIERTLGLAPRKGKPAVGKTKKTASALAGAKKTKASTRRTTR